MEIIKTTTTSKSNLRKSSVERRKFHRFDVQHASIASSPLKVIGPIMNISMSGLAFYYVASSEQSKETTKLNIFSSDHTFRLNSVPFEVVWDAPIFDNFHLGSIVLRHCGVKFGILTDQQKADLRYFIQNYTIDK
jgi:hypothetical protein